MATVKAWELYSGLLCLTYEITDLVDSSMMKPHLMEKRFDVKYCTFDG